MFSIENIQQLFCEKKKKTNEKHLDLSLGNTQFSRLHHDKAGIRTSDLLFIGRALFN